MTDSRVHSQLALAATLAFGRGRLGRGLGAIVGEMLRTIFADVADEIAGVSQGLAGLDRMGLAHSFSTHETVFARFSSREEEIDFRGVRGLVGLEGRLHGSGIRDLVEVLADLLGLGQVRAPIVIRVSEIETLGTRTGRRGPVGQVAFGGSDRSVRLGGRGRRPWLRLIVHDGSERFCDRGRRRRERSNEGFLVETRPGEVRDPIAFPLWGKDF